MRLSARSAAALALAVLAAACFEWWPKIRNEFFVLTGSRNEAGGWYGFHSGFGGSAYITVPVALGVWYYHHSCNERRTCLRWGAYEVAGGLGRKCHRHHPDLRDHPRERHGEVLDRLHREWKQRRP